MPSSQKSPLNLSGWVLFDLAHQSWGYKSGVVDEYFSCAVLFKDGSPLQYIPIRDGESGCKPPDTAHSVPASAWDTIWEKPIQLDYSAVFRAHTRDNKEHELHEYLLLGKRVKQHIADYYVCQALGKNHFKSLWGDDVAITIHSNSTSIIMGELREKCVQYAAQNPNRETVADALRVSHMGFDTLTEALGLSGFVRALNPICISSHTETVHIPTQSGVRTVEDPVQLLAMDGGQIGTIKVLCVVDTTKRKPVYIPVPPQSACSRQALAWTFGLTYEQYSTLYLQS